MLCSNLCSCESNKGQFSNMSRINDIVGTLEMGASGLVLEAETTIGNKLFYVQKLSMN